MEQYPNTNWKTVPRQPSKKGTWAKTSPKKAKISTKSSFIGEKSKRPDGPLMTEQGSFDRGSKLAAIYDKLADNDKLTGEGPLLNRLDMRVAVETQSWTIIDPVPAAKLLGRPASPFECKARVSDLINIMTKILNAVDRVKLLKKWVDEIELCMLRNGPAHLLLHEHFRYAMDSFGAIQSISAQTARIR